MEPSRAEAPQLSALAAKMKQWRADRQLTLHQAKAIIGISVGYISGIEAGNVPVTLNVFRKYHAVDPLTFEPADAGLLL